MKIKYNLDTILFYVENVEKLKAFYCNIFGFEVIESYESSWALLSTGSCKIGLHQIGELYRNKVSETFKSENNVKIVFEIDQDINEVRSHLIDQGAKMRSVKTFDEYEYWLCDGTDPEGNVFQIKQPK